VTPPSVETLADLSWIEANWLLPRRNLLPGNSAEAARAAGTVQRAFHFAGVARNTRPGTWPALAYDRVRCLGFNRAKKEGNEVTMFEIFAAAFCCVNQYFVNSNCMAAKQRT